MGGKLKKPRRNNYRKPSAWQKSLMFRFMASEAISAFNRKRPHLPKCGAHAKSTGEGCRNLAMGNGRCWLHGGRTPSGDQWGLRQFRPKPRSRQTASDWPKVEAKLRKQERDDKDRARRLSAMSDDDFRTYVRRLGRRLQGTMKRMVARERARRGIDRPLVPESFSRPIAISPELAALKERIEFLKAELAAAMPAEKNSIDETPTIDSGVFG